MKNTYIDLVIAEGIATVTLPDGTIWTREVPADMDAETYALTFGAALEEKGYKITDIETGLK